MISKRRKAIYFGLTLLILYGLVEAISLAGYALSTGHWLSLAEADAERERVRAGEPPLALEGNDRGPLPQWQVLHPYLGFVLHPSKREGGSNDYGFVGKLPPFRTASSEALPSREDHRAVVAVVGGSLAQRMVDEMAEQLGSALAESACFAGRTVEVVNLALPGVKQPQQLMTLNYFLSVGAVIDVLISLDGFNEVVLPIVENDAQGVYPFYPRNWKFQTAGLEDVSLMRRVGEVEFWRELRKDVAVTFSLVPLRYSASANLLWSLVDRAIDRNAKMKMVDLTLAQGQGGSKRPGYLKRGPTRNYSSEEAHTRDLIAVWERAIRLMHGTSRTAGIASFHFLQPNQRVPESKIFAPGEREVALPKRHAYDAPARRGYPGLIAAGKRMHAEGIPFDDLTMVFAEVSEPVYTDGCCHVNRLGSQKLVLEIARIVRDRFDAGEPCPSFE
ncbi:MAG: hypothetical protein JRG94_24305 [Deltaproteobacteria bacterium]|nr:hypothetical protein [Deltaproteobacteria bacterium]